MFDDIDINNIGIESDDKDLGKFHGELISEVTVKLGLSNGWFCPSIYCESFSKKGIQNDQFYKLATVSNSNAPMTIYLHKDINILMNDLFPKTDFFPFLGGNWFSFDFNTKKDPFTLDGVSFINDSIPNKLSLLKGLQAQTLTSPKFIPQNFCCFLIVINF